MACIKNQIQEFLLLHYITCFLPCLFTLKNMGPAFSTVLSYTPSACSYYCTSYIPQLFFFWTINQFTAPFILFPRSYSIIILKLSYRNTEMVTFSSEVEKKLAEPQASAFNTFQSYSAHVNSLEKKQKLKIIKSEKAYSHILIKKLYEYRWNNKLFFSDQHSFSNKLNSTFPIFYMSVRKNKRAEESMLFQRAKAQIHKNTQNSKGGIALHYRAQLLEWHL